MYVPRDEAFSDIKQATFSTKTVYSALHAVVPSLEIAAIDPDLGFPFFTDIESLYNEGVNLPPLKNQGLFRTIIPRLIKTVTDANNDVLRFETPDTLESRILFLSHLSWTILSTQEILFLFYCVSIICFVFI